MVAKDLNTVKVDITIGGKPCDFSTMTLHQTMSSHHLFTIKVNYRAKQNSVWEEDCKRVFGNLKDRVVITISESEGAKNIFEGLISHIDIKGESSNQGEVILTGGSPTLLMLDDYHMDSFVNMSFGDIVHEVIGNLGIAVSTKIDPDIKSEQPFIYRYKESSYGFLRRLAVSCGESFYYDGRQLVVGFPKQTEEDIILSFKNDLITMSLCSSISNYDVERYDYDYTRDYLCQQISYPYGSRLDKYSYQAYQKSQSVYKDYMIQPSLIAARTTDSSCIVHRSTLNDYFSKLSDGSYFKASTTTCKLKLNSAILVETDPNLDKYTRELDRFRVIEITHHFDENKKSYHNDITAVNIDVEYFPIRDYVQPIAMPEVGTVVDNADPKNLGRVKVKFMWQKLNDHPQHKTSDWIRVQTPDAGSSSDVEKNRGFFFVPEIDDQVMIGFELGDPNRPFVMGSLFHSNNSQGISEDNTIKTIRSRSGHTVEFNDDEKGNWGISIKDREGNIICFDTKGRNIEITAPETIRMNAKNILINAVEVLSTASGKDTNMQIGKNLSQNINDNHELAIGKSKEENIGDNFRSTIVGEYSLSVEGDIKRKGNNINETSNGYAQYNSVDKLILKSSDEVIIAQ